MSSLAFAALIATGLAGPAVPCDGARKSRALGELQRYLAARATPPYEAQAQVYWNRVAERRKVRAAKRRSGQPVGPNDYVLTQPPV